MRLWDAAGYLASGLVVMAFCMRDIIPLRVVALTSNIAFLIYGIGLGLIPDCGDTDSSAAPSAPSTAPISHWTTIRFCNGCPGRAARSMSQGLRVLV